MSINSIIDHPQILNPKPKEIKLLTDSQHPSFKKLDNLEKEITEKKPIGSCAKILIAGPPHSGKSVFERGLRKSFPSVLDVTRIAAQPDGEGDWTNDLYSADPDLAKSLRIKGKFTRDNVEHWKTQITNSNNRFNLIDVGGVISPENAEIADLANSIIIVSRDKESAKEWIRFANEHNLNILGVFESTLDEDRQDEERFDVVSGKEWETEGVIYGLDRKSFVSSETIKFLVAYLLDRVPAPEAKTELAPGYTTITMDNIVTAIGKVYESKELPGRIGEFQINWSPEDLPKVYKELSRIGSLGGKFVIQGVAPQFLINTIIHALHPNQVALTDTKVEGGVVGIETENKFPKGEGLGPLPFTVTPNFYGGTLVEYAKDSMVNISTKDLNSIVPPEVDTTKPVFLSGRTANWAVAEIASAYSHVVPAIYMYKPNTGFICCITHSPEYTLGDVIASDPVRK